MKKSFIIYCLGMFLVLSGFAQDKPMRVGLKFGVPNIAGLNLEYATGKFAPTLDFSYFSLGDESTGKVSFSYIEIGSNYYFKEEGKGFYGHLSYGRVGLTATYDDAFGKGEGTAAINLVNIKIGAKLGNGFYFRPEIGFAAGGGGTYEVTYDDASVVEYAAPSVFGGVVFNLGFGVAF
jgi:hypothetical protein